MSTPGYFRDVSPPDAPASESAPALAADAQGPVIEFRVLGPMEAVLDGVALNLGPPKQRAVLAALLLAEGRVVSTGRLVEAVWGADPPPQAVPSLQAYVSKLRSVLSVGRGGGDSLTRRAPGYVLRALDVDLVKFRRLTRQAAETSAGREWALAEEAAGSALGLWRGPLLADLSDRPWVAGEAAQLDESRARCTEVLVTALLGLHRTVDAAELAQELVAEYPLREHARWLAMTALHQVGRSAEALDVFLDGARQLDEQLGLEPGAELRSLQTAILRQDPAIAAWPAEPGPRPGSASRRAHTAPAGAPAGAGGSWAVARPGKAIVGRDKELAVIEAMLNDIAGGRERWLLLTGPPGIGKTRLAEEAAQRAQARGMQASWSSCPDDEGVPAWWPLRPLVRDTGTDPDTVFLPEEGLDADTMRFKVYEKLSSRFADASAREPVLMVIDDAQWLDAASLRCLTFLTKALRGQRIGIVLTMRDGEHQAKLDQLLSAFARQDSAMQVAVPPLSGTSASALLYQVSGDDVPPSEAFTLAARTGGNPLLLTEYASLPRAERDGGNIPLAVRNLLGRRLSRLSAQVLSVLRAAAVVGEVFELGLLADVEELNLADVVDLLDAAAADTIIVPARDGYSYQFGHALLRDEILLQLSVMRRQALHARVAEALAQRGSDPQTLIRRASHLSAALPVVDPGLVVAACTAAARDAEARWDWDTAAQQWAAALTALKKQPRPDQNERDELLLARLDALARAGYGQGKRSQGDIDGAAAHLREGISGSDELQLPVTRVQLRWAEASQAEWHGDLDRAETLLARARDLHAQTELYEAEVSFLAARLSLLWHRGRVVTAADAVARAREPLVWAALVAAESGRVSEGRQLVARRLRAATPDYWYALGHMTLLGHAAADLRDVDSAGALLEWLSPNRPYIAAIGQVAIIGPVALATARLRALLGDRRGARADLALAHRQARAGRGRVSLPRIRLAEAQLDLPGPERSAELRAVDTAAPHGLAPVCGAAPGVGVAGFLTGGGIGPLSRTFGVGSDHVHALEVVTGEGRLLRITPDEHEDLFWGLRGGKATLGIVTAVEIGLVPLADFYGGSLWFSQADTGRVLHRWRQLCRTLPEQGSTSAAITQLPPLPGLPEPIGGRQTLAIRFAWTGDPLVGARHLDVLREAAAPVLDDVSVRPQAEVGRVHNDPVEPRPALDHFALLHSLTDEAIDRLLAAASQGNAQTIIELRLLGGAIARTPRHPSALCHRDAAFTLFTAGVPAPDPAAVDGHATRVLAAMSPWTHDGLWANFCPSNDRDLIARCYDPDALHWLASLGDQYDPDHVLHTGHVVRR
jgi:DNA-binding SARP family transcriptional activator